MNILFLTDKLTYTDGITKHLFYLLDEFIKSKKIKSFIICGGGAAIKKFTNNGIGVIEWPEILHKNRSVKNFSTIVFKTLRFSRSNGIQIIHSHNHYAANIAALAAKLAGVRTVQTNHGLIDEKGLLKHFNAQKYIAVNDHIKNYIIENKIALPGDTKLIRHGIPKEFPQAKKITNGVKIISASRLTREKGLDILIKAAGYLKFNFNKQLSFLVAGAGEDEKELVEMNESLNAGVRFCGVIEDLSNVLHTGNIFILPTRSRSEGFPFSLIEASLAGNLIITSNFSGLNFIFENNVDGLIFESGNHIDLADKIIYSIMNPEHSEKMRKNFSLKITKLFDLKTMVNKHLELYRECLA